MRDVLTKTIRSTSVVPSLVVAAATLSALLSGRDHESLYVAANVALEAGGVLVGEKIKIELDIQAVKA